MSKCEVVLQPGETPVETKKICLGISREMTVPADTEIRVVEPVNDGWYSKIQVKNNCIIGVGQTEVPPVVAPPCSPTPQPCGGGSGGGAGVTISGDAGNTTVMRPDGLYSKTYIEAGTSISVAGSGTRSDPYRISSSGGSGGGSTTILTHQGSGIKATTVGDTVTLELEATGIDAGVHKGVTYNAFGQATGFSEAGDLEIPEFMAGQGIGIDKSIPGIVSIGLEPILPEEVDVSLGHIVLSFNTEGQLSDVNSTGAMKPEQGRYNARLLDFITIGADGQITELIMEPNGNFHKGLAVNMVGTFQSRREEDILNFNSTIPGVIVVEIFSPEVKASTGAGGTTTTYPRMSSSGMGVIINGKAATVIHLAEGHALARSNTAFEAGENEINVRYDSEIRSLAVVKVYQEIGV